MAPRRHTHRPEVTCFHGMITTAPNMVELFELLQRVARTQASVLVRGESGTGKELVARALHRLSSRADGPYRAVNCATFTAELLASELFGHVRGAFTGAVRDRPGLFSVTDGGTLFLDEIAEMPLHIQAQLLRVLQDHSFIPLGATEPKHVDVRILTATHSSLRRAVAERRFREDLLYRVRVVPLYLPPLVHRPGDIYALAWHYIDELNKRGGRMIEAISDDALQAMLHHEWPGNVRELANVMEYAFAVGQGPDLCVEDLTPELRGEPPPEREGRDHGAPLGERERLMEVLEQHNWHRGNAADELGISRTTLWRKLREAGLAR